jgi:hypothetical protein
MRRSLACVLGVAVLAATSAGAYDALAGGRPHGAVIGTVSTGALCTSPAPRARTACARWRRGDPKLELSPVDRMVRERVAVMPDADGRFRLELAPGRYVAWWASTTRSGSLTNRGMHAWRVQAGRTTSIGTVTPYIAAELDAR